MAGPVANSGTRPADVPTIATNDDTDRVDAVTATTLVTVDGPITLDSRLPTGLLGLDRAFARRPPGPRWCAFGFWHRTGSGDAGLVAWRIASAPPSTTHRLKP